MPKIQKFKFNIFKYLHKSEEAVRTCSLKNLFWSISDNSQENACAGNSFWVDYIFTVLFQAYHLIVLILFLFIADQQYFF